MPINLANVHLTIQQFQAISAGKYNAGEVRLTSDHTLGKINHHVSLTGSNKVSLSHAEVLAIKDAFVRALSQNGVGEDAIARVRRDLGLAPDGAADVKLAERSITPLSREQIRSILDRNANAINGHAGAGTIRTHAEIYARFTPEQRDGFAQTRREPNAAMIRQRATLPDRGIADAQAVLAGDVRFANEAERQRLISAVQLQKNTILEGSHGNPSDAPGAKLTFTRAVDGLAVTFALGASEKEYVRKLDDMLLYLRLHAEPHGRNEPIPSLSAAEANKNMRDALMNRSSGYATFDSEAVKAAVRREFETRFGADVFRANAPFYTFAPSDAVKAAFESLGDMSAARFTPGQIVDAIVAKAAKGVMKLYFSKALAPMIEAAGGMPGAAAGVATNLVVRHPQIAERLLAARNPDEARAILNSHLPEIESGIRRQIACDRACEAAKAVYRERIAGAMGIPPAALEARGVLSTNRLGVKAFGLMADIGAGRVAANANDEIEQAYRRLAEEMADERINLLRAAEALDIPAEACDILKNQILTLDKVGGFDLADFKQRADAISVDKLLNVLSSDASADEILAAMGEVGQKVETGAIAIFAGAEVGGDEVGAAANLLVTLALAKRPESFDLLRAFFARPDMDGRSLVNLEGPASRAVAFQLFQPEIPANEANEKIAGAIGKPGLPPLYVQALRLAMDDIGIAALPEVEKTKLLAGASGRAIARQIRQAGKTVTPSQLRALARIAFKDEATDQAARRYVAKFAAANNLSAEGAAGFTADILFRRNKGLRAALDAAIAKAAVAGENVDAAAGRVLAEHDATIAAAVGSLNALTEAGASAHETAVREIARRANLDEVYVREKLNDSGLSLEGGSLDFLRGDIRDELANPATDIAAWDVGAVSQRAAQKIESFIAKKAAFIGEIDRMPLISEAKRGALVETALSYPPYKDPELASAVCEILGHPYIQAVLQYAQNALSKEKVAQMEDEDVFRVFEVVAEHLSNAIEAVLPAAKRAQMDNDDHSVVRSLIGEAFVDFCGKKLMDAAAGLASKNRLKAIDDIGHSLRKRFDDEYMTYSLGLDANRNAVPVDLVKAAAANKRTAVISFAQRLLSDVSAAFDDEWLPADLAVAVHRSTATEAQSNLAAGMLRHAPSALERAKGNLGEAEVARLKAFAITLDWRDGAAATAEALLHEAAGVIRMETDEARREERLAALASRMFNVSTAAAAVAAAAEAQGVRLDKAQTARAVDLLGEFSVGMPAKNARLLARFIASLRLTAESAEMDAMRLRLLAPSLAQWRDFPLEAPGNEAVAAFFKNEANAFVLDYEKPASRADNFANDVFKTFVTDIPRAIYTISGKRFMPGSDPAIVVGELEKLNLAPAAKRAITALMNQASALPMLGLQMHMPQPPNDLRAEPLDPSTLPGAGAFVSRAQSEQGEFLSFQVVDDITSIYDLTMSEDGKTATLKLVKAGRLVVGTEDTTMETRFGSVVVEEELTIDLSGDMPNVTNVRLSQTFDDSADLMSRYLAASATVPPAPPAPGPVHAN